MVTYPEERDNPGKLGLIPHVILRIRCLRMKWSNPLREGPAAYQLVGEVTAHQGYDG